MTKSNVKELNGFSGPKNCNFLEMSLKERLLASKCNNNYECFLGEVSQTASAKDANGFTHCSLKLLQFYSCIFCYSRTTLRTHNRDYFITTIQFSTITTQGMSETFFQPTELNKSTQQFYSASGAKGKGSNFPFPLKWLLLSPSLTLAWFPYRLAEGNPQHCGMQLGI